jgi:hypothetical protein
MPGNNPSANFEEIDFGIINQDLALFIDELDDLKAEVDLLKNINIDTLFGTNNDNSGQQTSAEQSTRKRKPLPGHNLSTDSSSSRLKKRRKEASNKTSQKTTDQSRASTPPQHSRSSKANNAFEKNRRNKKRDILNAIELMLIINFGITPNKTSAKKLTDIETWVHAMAVTGIFSPQKFTTEHNKMKEQRSKIRNKNKKQVRSLRESAKRQWVKNWKTIIGEHTPKKPSNHGSTQKPPSEIDALIILRTMLTDKLNKSVQVQSSNPSKPNTVSTSPTKR